MKMWYYSITFSDSSFINPFCAYAVFERSTDKEWCNPSGTSSDGWGDSLEQSCLGVANSKARRTLYQQLTIICCSMFRLHTVVRERVYEQTQRDTPLPVTQQKSLNANFWQLTDWLTDYFFKIHFAQSAGAVQYTDCFSAEG